MDLQVLRDIPIKWFSIQAIKELSNLLDSHHGDITIEVFCEKLQSHCRRSKGIDLKMSTSWISAIRDRARHIPTEFAFCHFRHRKLTIGDVMHVLDEMGAAYDDILRPFTADILHSCSSGTPTQGQCPCMNCHQGYDIHSSPPSYVPQNVENRTEGQRSVDWNLLPQDGRDMEWEPPTCDCNENGCDICEQQRLISDPEETAVLSAYSNTPHNTTTVLSAYSNAPHYTVPRRDLVETSRLHTGQSEHEDNVQSVNISYSENPSLSNDLRCAPDGLSSRGLRSTSTQKSLMMNQNINLWRPDPLQCTCNKAKKRQDKTSKRNSIPPASSRSLDGPRSSASDPNLATSGLADFGRGQDGRKRILISYTDDAKRDMIQLASTLKGQGHIVNTDLPSQTFMKAKSEGLVCEQDQYAWLRNKYTNADYVIVCSSKGFAECMNSDEVMPSTTHLNARYIYGLIKEDQRAVRDKIIDVSFIRDTFCLEFPVHRFVLPRDNDKLYFHINWHKTYVKICDITAGQLFV